MSIYYEALVSLLIVAGSVFVLVGSWGLIKLPDLLRRLHAPTKATTAGVGGTLVGSMVYFFALKGGPSMHELLITLFLFLTAPITAHFIAKAYLHFHVDPAAALPPTSGEHGWSTFDALPEQRNARPSEPTDGR
ncbi:Na+/H+ antiporter subunit G [Aromatoleum diolicum]|uniref:Na+/H+ antiporter subunit G n=1 Tax=Aromatoleum diolicum TaxID=75796 RepID=A0ABX1Q778_9RHOO|nr:Na+/H+ antiporter subunit G [Aromatoleum diolicum]NMG73276.1 Na+/H+ antiporter subunit G [Aromatoleum diolicum]